MCRDKESFKQNGVDEDIVTLRYKHHCGRLIDSLNRVLEERIEVKRNQ